MRKKPAVGVIRGFNSGFSERWRYAEKNQGDTSFSSSENSSPSALCLARAGKSPKARNVLLIKLL